MVILKYFLKLDIFKLKLGNWELEKNILQGWDFGSTFQDM